MLIKTTYPNFTVVISFVFGLGIINEFEHTIQEMSKLEMWRTVYEDLWR